MSRRLPAALALVALVVLLALFSRSSSPDASRSNPPASEPVATNTPVPPPAARVATNVPSPRAPAHADAGTAPTSTKVSHWGSGPNDFGRTGRVEGNPEAPMSITVAPDGSLVVLDQVNDRLVRVKPDGTRESIPSPVQSPQDVAVTKNGTLAVLDRLSDRTVSLVSPDGRVLGQLALEGANVPEGGGVTGVFADGDDVYVEYAHGATVHLGDANGAVDEQREETPGRPSRDGKSWLSAALADRTQGTVLVTSIDRARGVQRFGRLLRFGSVVDTIVLVDSDASGLVVVAVHEPEEGGAGVLVVVTMDPNDGHPLQSIDLPANGGADETFRELAVGDGTLTYAARDDGGLSLETFPLR